MTDNDKIRAEIEKLYDRAIESITKEDEDYWHGRIAAYRDAFSVIDSMQEEPKSDWLQEFHGKLDSLSKEDFAKVWAKYNKYGKEVSVDYDKLNTMLDESLSKETKESWNEWLGEEPASDDEIEKQFKVGDIVVYMSRHPAYSGLYLLGNPNDLSIGYSNANEPYQIALRNCTVASEDEHRQFMRELNDNGYKWNEVTLRIDKKEKPVSDFEVALTEMLDKAQKCVVEPWAIAAQWKDELVKLAKSGAQEAKGQNIND